MSEKDVTFSMRLDADLRAAFSAACEAQDMTAAQVLRRFMRDFIKGGEAAKRKGKSHGKQ